MKITEDSVFKSKLLDRIAAREFRERSGVHCSDLIYCLNKQALRRARNDPPTEQELLTYSLGWMSQRWLVGQDADEPEVQLDGIIVTCDALDDGVPWELKATFQSSSKPIVESTHWLRQIMAQCKVQNVRTAQLTRLELMGNWKSVFGKKEEKDDPENGKPTLHAYKLEFTPEEIETNWSWLRSRKPQFERILETSVLLPPSEALPPCQTWECGWCRFRNKECEGVG